MTWKINLNYPDKPRTVSRIFFKKFIFVGKKSTFLSDLTIETIKKMRLCAENILFFTFQVSIVPRRRTASYHLVKISRGNLKKNLLPGYAILWARTHTHVLSTCTYSTGWSDGGFTPPYGTSVTSNNTRSITSTWRTKLIKTIMTSMEAVGPTCGWQYFLFSRPWSCLPALVSIFV